MRHRVAPLVTALTVALLAGAFLRVGSAPAAPAASAEPARPEAQATPTGPRARRHDSGNLRWVVEPIGGTHTSAGGEFTLTAKPGEVVATRARVANASTQPVALRLFVADAFNTETGSIDVRGATEQPVDVAAWASVERPRVELAADEHVDVTVTFRVPSDAAPGDHVGGVVAALDGPVTTSDGHVVQIARRVRTLVTVRVAGELDPRLTVHDVALRVDPAPSPLHPSWVGLSYVVRNTGNVRLGATQRASVHGLVSDAVGPHDLDDLPDLLPGQSVHRIVEVGRVRVWSRVSVRLRLEPVTSPGFPALPPPTPVTTSASRWSVRWMLWLGLTLAVSTSVARLRRRRRGRGAAAR